MGHHHWTKICCPVDFSEASWEALMQAAELAAHGGADLVILHVYERSSLRSAGEILVTDPDLEDRLAHEVNHNLDRYRRDAERLAPGRVSVEAKCGDPTTEIVHFAERGAFDLIVVGMHGRSALQRLMLGSVAQAVVRHAPCSVLVVRPAHFHIEPD